MKITCELTSLAKEVSRACSFAQAKNSLSMSSCILLSADASSLTVRATDGKMWFTSRFAVGVNEPGEVAVFADKISAVLKNLPDGPVNLSEKDGKLTVEPAMKNNIKVNIKYLDASKFPGAKVSEAPSVSFVMKTADFISMAESVAFAVSDDTSRAFLTGVCMESRDGKFTMVATDGRRLAMNRISTEIPAFEPVIIPVRFFQQLKGITDEIITINLEGGDIFAVTKDTMVSSSLIGGRYPNYERVIPADAVKEVKVNAADFDRAINLVSVMTDANTKRIFIDIDQTGINVYGEDSNYGESSQTIPCTYEGDRISTSFNVLLLSQCIKKIPTADAVLRFPESQRAWVITPTGDEGITYVLAPMNT